MQATIRKHADGNAWYHDHLMPADEAVKLFQPGDHAWFSIGQQVNLILSALLARLGEVAPIEIYGTPTTDISWCDDELASQLHFNVPFSSVFSREVLADHRADFLPWWVWGAHKALDEGRPGANPLDVAIFNVSPPNEHGYVCFGASLWDAKTTALRARSRIAIVNPATPLTFGDTWMHCSEVDAFVLNDEPPPEQSWAYPPPDPWDAAIAHNVSELVRDGDTIQLGTGSTTGSMPALGAFDGKHDLGYFAELTVPGTVDLVKKGVITSRFMTSHPGKFVTTTAGNSPGDLAFINGNPMFEFYPVDYMHNPASIARNDNMVAINNALSVDLTGQIAAGSIGQRIWSGTGGQLSYGLGALLSKGGRSICVLPSTATRGTTSRIVGEFAAGQAVTITRDIADIIVTEYGIAHLLNKTLRQRANELVSVAHPDFRSDLRRETDRLFSRM